MNNENIYFKYSSFLQNHYHTKVYKLPVNLPVTCPNRIHGSGCTFCSEKGTGFEAMPSSETITDQLLKVQEHIRKKYKAQKFIAYFQNYTNTFMPIDRLATCVREAGAVEDVVEISISTRPDCIREDYLEMLEDFSKETGILISIELGLQTVNYHTLKQISRGHGLAEYIDACLRIKKHGFLLCTHVILNLPGDDLTDVIETARILSVLGNDLVKIHSLYIAKGTPMAQEYLEGRLKPGTKSDYFLRLRHFLEYLDSEIAVERLFSRIPEEDALFSNWQTSWWKLQEEFMNYMIEEESFQGKKADYKNGRALHYFDRSLES